MLAPLTGMRFVAALAVVLYHLPMKPFAFEPATRLIGHGYLGVSFFFVLSGFILAYTYIQPDTGALRGSARDFWWSRVARVYPVYLLALLVALPIFLIFRVLIVPPAARSSALVSGLLTPLLLQSWSPSAATQWNTPGWSLSVELFFYAIFPFTAVWLAQRQRPALVASVTWLACLSLPLAYVLTAPSAGAAPGSFDRYYWLQAIKFNPIAHLGEFFLGVSAGVAFVRRRPSSILQSPLLLRIALAGVMIAATVAATTDWLPYALCHNGLLAPLWVALVLGLATSRGRLARVLGSTPVQRLGEASFALYLLHSPLIGYHELARGFLRMRQPGLASPAWVQAALLVVTGVIVSLLVFERVEQPARRAIRDWARRQSPRAAARGTGWRLRATLAQES